MIGYDIYNIYCNDIVDFLNQLKRFKISIYHLHQIDEYTYSFMASFFARKKIKQINLAIEYQDSNGLLFFILSFFHNKVSILGAITFFTVYSYLNLFIWQVNIEGITPAINKKIQENLSQYEMEIGSFKKNQAEIEKIKEQIANDFTLEIDWLNIYLEGNTYNIKYTKRVENDIIVPDYEPIFACKTGIIESINVQEGNILVKVNQYIKEGDILVDNTLVTTLDEIRIIPTKGVILGYTWKTYEASIESSIIDEAEAFSYLLDHIRTAVHKDISETGLIDQENVLQFTTNEGKMILKVHYTFLEDISCKKGKDWNL